MPALRPTLRVAPRLAPWGLLLLLAGCTRNAPLEATLADLQERQLWRGETAVYASEEYEDYRRRLRRAKDLLIETEGRFLWFRDYDAVAREYQGILARGDEIFDAARRRREQRRAGVEQGLAEQRAKIERLDTLTSLITVGKTSREFLTKADLLADEAEALASQGRYPEAEERLKRAAANTKIATEVSTPALRRFVDRDQITTWRSRVAETIRESKIRGSYAIVVSKVDRKLVLYKAGRPVKTYEVGLGSGSIRDKVCAGDRATPEGRYRIVKKLPQSRFHKALLINYPNEDDLRQFALAKRRGEVRRGAGPGGLIEIHGGGRDGLTLGCVALDDHHMDEVYALAEVGTPVTIVGATDFENSVARALKGL